jgi:hypothetical protein
MKNQHRKIFGKLMISSFNHGLEIQEGLEKSTY